jgi:hypothetical protein
MKNNKSNRAYLLAKNKKTGKGFIHAGFVL